MPTLQAEQTVQIDLDFEVFCKCKAGLCNSTETRQSRNRGMPQVIVEPCTFCLDAAREEAAGEAESEIKALKEEIARLESLLPD